MAEEVMGSHPARKRLGTARERALLEVALDLLGEMGYDRMSLDEVARRAHASKSTLYRRWPSKADLIAAALIGRKVEAPKPPPADTLRDDLLAEVSFMCREMSASRPLTQGLLTALCTDRRLGELITLQGASALQQDVERVIARAVERGELPARATEKAATVAEVMHALIASRLLLGRAPLDADAIEHQVDTILLPILRAV